MWSDTSEKSKVSLSGSWPRGATSFNVTSASGLSVGDWLVVCQGLPSYVDVNGANGNATWLGRNDSNFRVGQLVTITAINGATNITVSRAAYLDYTVTPKYMEYGYLSGAGVEDLKIIRTSSGTGYNIYMRHTRGCWIKNVTSVNTGNGHFFFYIAAECEANHCDVDSSNSSFSHEGDRELRLLL